MPNHFNFSICNHPRNLTDNQITALAKKKGVIGLTLVPDFISDKDANLSEYLDHFDYVVKDYICIGTDFDVIDKTIPEISDCSMMYRLTEGLLKRGYEESDVVKILGENMLRVIGKIIG